MIFSEKIVTKAILLLTGMTVCTFAAVAKEANGKTVSRSSRATNKSWYHLGHVRTLSVNGKQITLANNYARRIDKLRSVGVTVFYPTYSPERFHLASITIVDATDPNLDYRLEFRDKNNLSFAVESCYSGIGDGPDGDRTLNGNSKMFGPFTIDVFKPGSEGNCSKNIYYLSSWMSDKKRLDSEKKGEDPVKGRYYHFLGDGLSDKEAINIVQSLTPVQ